MLPCCAVPCYAVLCRSQLYEIHAKLLADSEQRVRELMAMERKQIWTQNDHYLSSSKEAFLSWLMRDLYGEGSLSTGSGSKACANGQSAKENMQAALAHLTQLGMKVTAEDIDTMVARKRQKTSFQCDDEGLLELIAGTLAYYKVCVGCKVKQ